MTELFSRKSEAIATLGHMFSKVEVMTRLGLPRGWTSRDLSTKELLHYASADADIKWCIEDEPASAAGAQLAGDVEATSLHLEPAGAAGPAGAGGAWRVRCVRSVPPGHTLRMWFTHELLVAADLPFLTLNHIRGKKSYVCDECGLEFERPNPLKIHLFLSCKPFSRARFWTTFLERVARLPPPPPPPLARVSAFTPYLSPVTSLTGVAVRAALSRLGPAQAEAVAAAWGGGHGSGHTCLYCGRVYSRRYGLKIHVRTHTGYKPLRCEHCRRAFADPSNLNKHLRLHRAALDAEGGAARGRHECGRCGAVLARRRDLERHVRARHPEP